jgi:exocyst complex component 8
MELVSQRQKMQTLSEETNMQLKKNVYQNYMQFIETAKEISRNNLNCSQIQQIIYKLIFLDLESEMYQLSHLLSEQRDLLANLLDTSIVGNRTVIMDKEKQPEEQKNKVVSEEEERRKLASIIEKVEGCVVTKFLIWVCVHCSKPVLKFQSLLEVPGRVLLHDSDLIELDINDNSAIQRYHGYLLNDSVVLASWIPNKCVFKIWTFFFLLMC